MRTIKRWNIAPVNPAAEDLAARLRVSSIVAQMLLNRGLSQADGAAAFLQPTLKHLHEPRLLGGLTRAAERVARAIRDRQKIVIYGDYDVDGITATAILWHAIRRLGGVVDYYVPHRLEEGYGLNSEAIEQICRDGAGLIITVDCGVTADGPASVARERGVDLIITDHHEWRERPATAPTPPSESSDWPAPQITPDAGPVREGTIAPFAAIGAASAAHSTRVLPDCYAIVHPRLNDEGADPYPNPHLCGAGVAFKLAWGIGLAMSGAARCGDDFREFLVEATALAALGTIADVVPLIGENRVLAHFGLSGLRQSRLTGVRALIASANLTGKSLDSFHVGFLLAPRLNACGRMGHARLAVEMLTSADEPKAMEIAAFLEQQNRARQAVEKKILDEAMQKIADDHLAADGKCAIVLASESWHPGVIGIVASRIVDRFHRPAVLVGLNNGHGQGSGRSISGFHLARALGACGEHLEAHGGHEMAAGLKLQTARFGDFRDAFCEHANRVIEPDLLVSELKVDSVAELQRITAGLVGDLNRLAPFGSANRRPLLVCRDVALAGTVRRVGKTGDHLQFLVRQGEATMKCIAFSFGDRFDALRPGVRLDLAVEPLVNDYSGRRSVELDVKDLQFVSPR